VWLLTSRSGPPKRRVRVLVVVHLDARVLTLDPSGAASPGAAVDPVGAPAVTLAMLPEVLTAREAAAILRVGRNQLYQSGRPRRHPPVRIDRTVNGLLVLPGDGQWSCPGRGQQNCPAVAGSSARGLPTRISDEPLYSE
jgi:hypothetical protein